jgi:hypothetical protein
MNSGASQQRGAVAARASDTFAIELAVVEPGLVTVSANALVSAGS